MRRKINKTITIIVSVAIIVFGIISVAAISKVYFDKSMENVENVARICAATCETPEEIAGYVEESVEEEVRVTYIDSDGKVVFDNQEDPADMGNHSGRQEFVDALSTGEGSEIRTSETIGKSTYYYALKFNDGVIRFAIPISNIYSEIYIVIAVVVIICAITIIIARIISKRIAGGFVKPITEIVDMIDIKSGAIDEENLTDLESDYEELSPIIEDIKYISERLQKYIERLKRQKERVSLIINNMVEGMVLIDGDGKILLINQSAKTILDPDYFEENEKEPENISELSLNDTIASMIETMETEKLAYNTIAVNDRYFTVYMNRCEYAGSYGIIILLVDATERVHAEKIRQDFSANVTHELKTPLTTIKGFGEMLEKKIITLPEEVSKYGGIVYRESERLLLLINDIMRLSEIEENAKEFSAVSLKKIADDVIEVLTYKAEENYVEIRQEVEDLTIVANGGYISELLINLIDNSIKYNVPHGYVNLKISDSGAYATIIVEDNGIGIPKDSLDRIFERFYRVDKSRSKQTGGTGLGLSIVKHIVTYHNGTIKISSKYGKGTKIVIVLPKMQ
ncbi:MAG: ATP-binding protein [Ruminococcus sp.]|nr:ATP-binding protein [Ruminococcus sp.]